MLPPSAHTGNGSRLGALNGLLCQREHRPPNPCWGPATPYLFSNFLPSAIALASFPPANTLSNLGQWRMPYEVWGRHMPHWGPRTLA